MKGVVAFAGCYLTGVLGLSPGTPRYLVAAPCRLRPWRPKFSLSVGFDSGLWPAAGFVDTEIGCCMKPEAAYAARAIWS